MYLYGKNSVLERIAIKPASIKCIFLQKNFEDSRVLDRIAAASIPTKCVSEKELTKIKRADRLQGIVAEVESFRYTPFEELVHGPAYKGYSCICLDTVQDPHNLGSIVRICACLGKFSVLIPKHRSCEVNDTVMHVASGGENFVPISMITNTVTALLKLKEAGYWVCGAVVEGGESIERTSLPFPLCLVLGSEGAGIRYGVDKHLDLRVSLPMEGAPLSFNVATACAIFCYEIHKQRSSQRKG